MTLVSRFAITPLGLHAGRFSIVLHGATESWIPSLQYQGDEWQRLGQTGSGTQIVGTRGRKITVKGWRGETALAAALTSVSNIESLEQEVCSVTDCYSRTLSRVRLSNLSAYPVKTRGPMDGTSQVIYRVECQFAAERLPDG